MEQSIPSSNACSSNCRLLFWLDSAARRQCWDPQRLIPVFWLQQLVSSAPRSRSPRHWTPLLPHLLPSLLQCLQHKIHLQINAGNTTRIIRLVQNKLSVTVAKRALREALRGKSSPEVAPPFSNRLPEADCSYALPGTDCLAGSPAESYTKTQPDGEWNCCSFVRT